MDLSKGIVVLPLLSFYFFLSFMASLALSIYLSFVLFWDLLFVLFGIFYFCTPWDLFLTLREHSINTRMNKINTLLQGTHNKTETIS